MNTVIYSDKRIVVAVKPAGVLSTDEDGGMPGRLRKELDTDCIRTIHRLDAQVSGLMVFARSAKAASILSEQIREHRFRKEYLAVVHGEPPESGTLVDLLGRDKRRRITYVSEIQGPDVREAQLTYHVINRYEGYSLVSICLQTGRTHQIRVQFASRGWPLVGDRKYGTGCEDLPIALWSYCLSFTHPESGQSLVFSQLPPADPPWSWFPELSL